MSEAAHFLGITEDKLQSLAEAGKVPAYKVGGVFLRFKQEQLEILGSDIKNIENELGITNPGRAQKLGDPRQKIGFWGRIKEFWHFFDFYVISILITGGILYIIFKLGV